MKWKRVLGYVITALGIIGVGLRFLFESAIIVSFGVHALTFFMSMACFVIGFGSVQVFLSFAPEFRNKLEKSRSKKLLREKIENDKERTEGYETDSLNPEKVRIRLEQLRDRNPNLVDLMDKCIEQKDEIDKYQEQLDRLIKANEATYLNDVTEVLNSAEERICANFRDIINCCILVEFNGKAINERNLEIVQAAISSNDDELKAVETLLDRSVAYINDFNRKGISNRSELDAWIETMERRINKKGEVSLD